MSASILEISEISPVDVLEIERAVNEAPAAGPPGSIRFVTFFFGNDLYGIEADQVAEVTHPLPVSPLPHGPEFLAGISPLRGEIVAVIDLCRMLGRTAATPSTRPKFVILRSTDNETQPAFKVDKMHELVTIEARSLNVDRSTGSIIIGTMELGEHFVQMLSPSALRDALSS